jgi:hypothetical protein
MLATATRSIAKRFAAKVNVPVRAMSGALPPSMYNGVGGYFPPEKWDDDGGGIAEDLQQAAGRERYELLEKAAGRVAFVRDPIIPEAHMGTKENPILVRLCSSIFHMRVVLCCVGNILILYCILRFVGLACKMTRRLTNLNMFPVRFLPESMSELLAMRTR